jgi:hypothetical protein
VLLFILGDSGSMRNEDRWIKQIKIVKLIADVANTSSHSTKGLISDLSKPTLLLLTTSLPAELRQGAILPQI